MLFCFPFAQTPASWVSSCPATPISHAVNFNSPADPWVCEKTLVPALFCLLFSPSSDPPFPNSPFTLLRLPIQIPSCSHPQTSLKATKATLLSLPTVMQILTAVIHEGCFTSFRSNGFFISFHYMFVFY